MRLQALRSSTFLSNERGTISIMFGAAIIAMVGVVGLSIDLGRSMDAYSKATSALDSAALAATRAMFNGDKTVGEVEDLAEQFFQSNLTSIGDIGADYSDFTANVDTETKTVKVNTKVDVPTTFGRIFGITHMTYNVSARATFNVQDIELSMVLDVTGSMCSPCSKIDALKDASKELINTLMPDNGAGGNVKIALAPFSDAVNAGPYAARATAGRSVDGCVVERKGANALSEAPPPVDYTDVTDDDLVAGDSLYFRASKPAALKDIDLFEGKAGYVCPDAQIIPLTTDKPTLVASIEDFAPTGPTAGHIGAAWGWYMISDEWGDVFGGDSAPKPYGTKNLIKAVVLMTDGVFNTAWNNSASAAQAKQVCDAMKDKDVIVYAVSFKSPKHPTMQYCASTDSSGNLLYWDAKNGDDLVGAFKDIAIRLTNLRLDK